MLAPELCNRQTFTQYDESVFESVSSSTHLVVVRDCDVSAVWRDRNAIEEALREVHVVLLFPEVQPRTSTRSWFLAEQVGMTAAGSIFQCVDSNDLYKREERADDQPPMKLSKTEDKNSTMLTVEASASVLLKRKLEQLRKEAPTRASPLPLAVLQKQLADVRAYQRQLAAGRRSGL